MGLLMVIFEKEIDVLPRSEAEWPSQQNILIFTSSYFTIFSSIC